MGKYKVRLETTPPSWSTIYLKPSTIFYKKFYAPVLATFTNVQEFAEYKLYYSYYPYKKWKLCAANRFSFEDEHLYLQPKKLYRLEYRKKAKRRYGKKKFYINDNMKEFIYKLE